MAQDQYDIAIVGGGIAGLSLAIQCACAGYQTIVFEKESYPKHKVCGEYISNESRSFLLDLGLPLSELDVPFIDQFVLSSHHGFVSSCRLSTGGFGLSRFELDSQLANLAQKAGAIVMTDTKALSVQGDFVAGYRIETLRQGTFRSKLLIDASGRNSALNKSNKSKITEAWIGVKYHLDAGPDSNVIEIHTFPDGYAGVSKIEANKYCFCYLTKASGLKACNSDIQLFEEKVLSKNLRLKARLKANKLVGPITTSQFYFGMKGEGGSFNEIGDALGFIPTLTGNGMSLALRSSKILFENVDELLSASIDAATFHKRCDEYMKGYLKHRVSRGVLLQNLLFLKPAALNKALMFLFSKSPWALRMMSNLAVGKTI